MKKITSQLLTIALLASVLFSFISCQKDKITSDCIATQVEIFGDNQDCNDGVQVDKYKFQGEIVYVFEPGNCGADMASEVLSESCKSLGFLGGLSGNRDINGENFDNATFVATVWSK